MFEILAVVALAMPADASSLRTEDWTKPTTEVVATGLLFGDSLECQKRAIQLIRKPLQRDHMGYYCAVTR